MTNRWLGGEHIYTSASAKHMGSPILKSCEKRVRHQEMLWKRSLGKIYVFSIHFDSPLKKLTWQWKITILIGDTWICFFLWFCTTDSAMANHHHSPPFGRISVFFQASWPRSKFRRWNHQLVIDCQHSNHENGILSNKNYSFWGLSKAKVLRKLTNVGDTGMWLWVFPRFSPEKNAETLVPVDGDTTTWAVITTQVVDSIMLGNDTSKLY